MMTRRLVLYCWIAIFTISFNQVNAQSEKDKLTTAGNIRMTVNNIGLIGNSFKGTYTDPRLRYPSCEYPAGSSIEHLFEGGLWVGAKVQGNVVVTTGAVDFSSGYTPGAAGFEFTADPTAAMTERSNRFDNPVFYRPDAVSHQDFVADFTDKNLTIPGTSILIPDLENGPLGADVHFEVYNWNFSFTSSLVILQYTITNSSSKTWDEPYLGLWVDPVVRNVSITPAGAGGTGFYNKGGTGYIDSLYTGYEFDATGDIGYTDSYFGLRYLGTQFRSQVYHPKLTPEVKVFFNSWAFRDFNSAYRTPQNDRERYERLSSGLNFLPEWETSLKPNLAKPGNRSFFISSGPYPSIQSGESITITFAVVCAPKVGNEPAALDSPEQKGELIKSASWAQAAFNGEDRNFNGKLDPGEDNNKNGKLDRYILPEPPPSPIDTIVAESNSIKIYWSNNAESFEDPISKKKDFEGYRIYKTKVGFDLADRPDLLKDLELIAQFDRPEYGGIPQNSPIDRGTITELNNGFKAIKLSQPVKFPGNPNEFHYLYEIKNVLNGWQHAVVVTAFDHGDPNVKLGPLESSPLTRVRRVFPGQKSNRDFANGDPFVYPNPYYVGASWERPGSAEEERKIIFANLPPRCEVRVYTVAGDLVYTFQHNQEDSGNDTRWYSTNASVDGQQKRVFSGGEHAWNLLSKDRQIIARGIYLYVVKDLDTESIRRSKFVVIK